MIGWTLYAPSPGHIDLDLSVTVDKLKKTQKSYHL